MTDINDLHDHLTDARADAEKHCTLYNTAVEEANAAKHRANELRQDAEQTPRILGIFPTRSARVLRTEAEKTQSQAAEASKRARSLSNQAIAAGLRVHVLEHQVEAAEAAEQKVIYLVNTVGEMINSLPVAAGKAKATFTVTGPSGDKHSMPVYTCDLEAIATAVQAGREEFDRSHPGHPAKGRCAFCDPDTNPVRQPRNAVVRLVNALDELVTNYPMDEGPTIRITLTDTDSTSITISLDPKQVNCVANLIKYVRNQAENDYHQELKCAWCGAEIPDEEHPVII